MNIFKGFNKLITGLKFRQKFLLAFLPIPLCTFIFGLIMYENTIDAVKETLERQTLISARNVSSQIENFVEERKLEINSVTKLKWIMKINDTEKNSMENLLLDLKNYYQISLFDLQKQPLQKVRFTSFNLRGNVPVHFESDIFNSNDTIGIEDCSTLKEEQVYLSNVINFNGFRAIVLGSKIFDSELKIPVGIITFVLPVSQFVNNIEKIYNAGFAAKAMVVDSSKLIIYHSERNRINQLISAAIPTLYLNNIHFNPDSKSLEGTTSYYDKNDDLYIASFYPIKILSWSVGIIVPINPYIQSTRKVAVWGVSITLFASLLIIFFILYISNRFNKGISELTEGAKAVASGNLDQKISIHSNDEIGELAKDFNRMSADLRKLLNEIDIHKKLSVIGQFAAGMYHDLKSPIEGLKLLSAGLKRKIEKDNPAKKYIDEIEIGINTIDRLIYETLDFVKPKSSDKQNININEFIKSIILELNTENVKTLFNFTEELQDIKIDSAQLGHVLRNIFNNSLESMPGKGELYISTIKKNESIKIEITDTGAGIAEKDLEKIFEPFYTTKLKGHGLGLSIVHQIIKMNNGKINIESKSGKGTKVIIELPI